MAKQGDGKKVCYYELLGVDRKCEANDIKLSYRKMALQLHPDKAHLNGYSVEDATKKFQQIQEAYSVLSDPQERTWYDAHREQILKGDDEPGDPFRTKVNLYKHFSTSCFDGFTDKDGGFFAVYGDLFQAINEEEAQWEDADGEHRSMPPFGGSGAEWADVSNFYSRWLDFCSRKAFGFADKWNPKDATSRQIRRAMEQENKKARQAAKKEFNAEVRQLVQFVQKRDPRVAAHTKAQAKASQEKAQMEKAKKEERAAEEAKEKERRREAARLEEQGRWEEVKAEREARRARGEEVSEDESSSSEEEQVEWYCEACRKSFKSEKAFDQHCKSKKHLQLVAEFRRKMEEEDEEDSESDEEDAEAASDVSVDLEAGGPLVPETAKPATASTPSPPPRVTPAGAPGEPASDRKEPKSDQASEDSDDSDDDFLLRFAATKQQGARGAAATVRQAKPEQGEDETEEETDGTRVQAPVSAGGGSKKQMKRETQKEVLLEKRAEKEHVQNLVRATKKAAKAEKNGTEVGLDEAEAAQVGANATNGKAAKGKKGGASEPSEALCSVCGEEFPSRTQLFKHIKESGHAVLKEMPREAAPKAGKKKKR